MREIVSIQVGEFANFIGSHFWNFQDELLGLAADPDGDPAFRKQCIDMDVLYRTGETQQGTPTYTPRLLSIGFPGSLGSMSSNGTLYNDVSAEPSAVTTWGGNVSSHASEPHKKNLFLKRLYEEEHENLTTMKVEKNGKKQEISDKDAVECLETGVHFWTDFSKVHYHPQSLYELSGLWMDTHDFDNYGIGRDTFSEGLRGEEITERLRYFGEECDHIQGFQFTVDDSGGFSALAADFLENIADEYTNTPVLLYTVRGPDSFTSPRNQKHKLSRNIHDAVSFSRMAPFCKLIVPLGLPSLSRSSRFLSIRDENSYHCSAVYAAALYSISLAFRMELPGPASDSSSVSGAMDINAFVLMLAGQDRQNIVSILDVAMPAPSLTGKQFEQTLLQYFQALTPEVKENAEDMHAVEAMTIHGAFGSGSRQAPVSEVKDAVVAAYEQATTRPRFCHVSAAVCPLPIPLPFPSIFSNLVGQHGELLGSPTVDVSSRGSLDVHSIPMAARVRSSSAILPFLEHRVASLRRLGIEQGAPAAELLRSWGFAREELEDMGEMLSKMVKALDQDRFHDSDSD